MSNPQPIDFWQIAHQLDAMPLAAIKIVAENGQLQHLKYLVLQSLPKAGMTLLFLECRSLEHASLIQLPGVGNEVFMDLPYDCVRSALRTLRIKTSCGVNVGDATSTGDLLPRLTQLFPNIDYFEYLLIDRPQFGAHVSRVHSQLSHILAFNQPSLRSFSRQLVWPRLRILTINHLNQSIASATDQSSSLQEALMSRRHINRRPLPLQLNLVNPNGLPHISMNSCWHHALHGATNVHTALPLTSEDDQGEMVLKLEYCQIACCYREMCVYHRGQV